MAMVSIITSLLTFIVIARAAPSGHLQHIPVENYHPKLQLLGQHVDLPEIPTKVIRITKTVAIKVPVPYPVKVPHGVPYPVQVSKPYPVPVTQIVKVPHPVPIPVPSEHIAHHHTGYEAPHQYSSYQGQSSGLGDYGQHYQETQHLHQPVQHSDLAQSYQKIEQGYHHQPHTEESQYQQVQAMMAYQHEPKTEEQQNEEMQAMAYHHQPHIQMTKYQQVHAMPAYQQQAEQQAQQESSSHMARQTGYEHMSYTH